jgi:adenosylcobinamide-phosphate synthase
MSPRRDVAGGSLVSCPTRVPSTALSMPLALALDAAFGEPPDWIHPVVWIGIIISLLVGLAPTGEMTRLAYGAIVTAITVGGAASIGAAVDRLLARLPRLPALLVEAWLLKVMLSARALLAAGTRVDERLDRDDLDGAREAVRALVSRDPAALDRRLLTSAAVESLAENASDSIVAPLFYHAVGGLPAAFAYRAANTLDAMIGYRGEYEHLGKVAARLDDLLNLVPARLTSALLLAAGAVGGGDLGTGLTTTMRDNSRTASPNAGWPMSTMAGLLGVRLEKPGHYELGVGLPPPDLSAIDHAAELVKTTTVLALPVMLGIRWWIGSAAARTGNRWRGNR